MKISFRFARFDFARRTRRRADGAPADAGRRQICQDVNAGAFMFHARSAGKTARQPVQVSAAPTGDLRDLTIAIRFEGEYDASYTEGDNRDVLPTDT
jgi:hypothetical protein